MRHLFSLLKREFHWWLKSAGVWWALFPLLLIIENYPIILSQIAGLDFEILAMQWNNLTQSVMLYANMNPAVKGFFLLPIGQEIKYFIDLPIEKIWSEYLCKGLQVWGILFPAITIVPIAVHSFNRDRDNGIFLYARINGISPFWMLFSKQMNIGLQLLWIQCLITFLFLKFFGTQTTFHHLFRFSDPIWLLAWIGDSISIAMFACSLCWCMCLITRNSQSEIYNSMLTVAVTVALVMYTIIKGKWNIQMGLILLIAPASLSFIINFIVATLMKREAFMIHRDST